MNKLQGEATAITKLPAKPDNTPDLKNLRNLLFINFRLNMCEIK